MDDIQRKLRGITNRLIDEAVAKGHDTKLGLKAAQEAHEVLKQTAEVFPKEDPAFRVYAACTVKLAQIQTAFLVLKAIHETSIASILKWLPEVDQRRVLDELNGLSIDTILPK